jgi:hypothetical protein
MTLLMRICVLAALTSMACSSDETRPDPLASRDGFCAAWAKAACSERVVQNCDANSVDDCRQSQRDECVNAIPDNYGSAHAADCIDAVKDAYEDAVLTAEELQIVRNQAAPCDRLSRGTREAGQSCESAQECDTVAGFTCVIKSGNDGTCQEPELVEPGRRCQAPAQVCGEGYYCNGENCVESKPAGASCSGDVECAPEDRCSVPAGEVEGECIARTELNGACNSSIECQSGYCAVARGDTSGECASNIVLGRSEPLCDFLK